MGVKIGKSKIWTVGRSKAVHIPKWWAEEHASSGVVQLYIDEQGRLIVEPELERGCDEGVVEDPPIATTPRRG